MEPCINTLRYLFLRGVMRLLAWLPLSLLHKLGRLLGSLFNVLPTKARRVTAHNLASCYPQLEERQRQDLVRSSLQHTACSILEMGKAWLPAVNKTVKLIRDSEGHEDFMAAIQARKGVILLAPHLSNWEIFGHYATNGIPARFMYQPPRSAAMDRLLKEGRSRGGVIMAPTNRKGVAVLLAALQRGELVGVLPDQVPPDGSGEFAPFFGEPAYTMTLVSKLARRTGAAVFCGFALRLPGGAGFKAIFKRVANGVYSEDMQESLRTMNAAIEECVELAPDQYQWEYKRFRRRPDNSEFY